MLFVMFQSLGLGPQYIGQVFIFFPPPFKSTVTLEYVPTYKIDTNNYVRIYIGMTLNHTYMEMHILITLKSNATTLLLLVVRTDSESDASYVNQ